MRLLLLLLTLIFGGHLQAESIRLTNGEWSPYLGQNLPHHGVASRIVEEAFALQGVQVQWEFYPWARALRSAEQGKSDGAAVWLRSPERDGQSLYLVSAGYHWQVVQGRRFCCGLTKEIVSIRDPKVMRRARVAGVWKIEQERKVALAEVLPAKPKRDTSMDTVRRKAKALAREIGVEIETSRTYDGYQDIIVWGPTWAADVDEEEVDPFYDDHYAENWEDAFERVKDYAELKRTKPEVFA